MRLTSRLPVALLVAAAACGLLCGCVEVEEDWTLDGKGGGLYALTIRWDADLWRRVTDVLGEATMGRLQGRPFPLRAHMWREGLARLDGVEILELAEGTTEEGWREIRLRLRFADLAAVLRWEVLARRTARVGPVAAKGAGEGDPPAVRFYMEPIARVPVLDRLAALLEAVERPPPSAEGAGAPRDPPPLERLGIERTAGEMVWRMVQKPLAGARLRFHIQAPGAVVESHGRPPAGAARAVEAAYDFAALRRPETDRTLDFVWQARAFDRPPEVSQTGDADPRSRRGADGTRR